jgi:hypothetical protein
MGVDAEITAELIKVFSKEGNEILKPGFVRISLPYYASDADVAFVADAVAFVAEHGWKLLPQYVPNSSDGTWRHVNAESLPSQNTLASIDYSSGQMRVDTALSSEPPRHDALLAEALAHADAALEKLKLAESAGASTPILAPVAEAKRWFLMPWEAAALARGIDPKAKSPFWPPLRGTVVPLLQAQMLSYKVARRSSLAWMDDDEIEAPAAIQEQDKRRHIFRWRKPKEGKPLKKAAEYRVAMESPTWMRFSHICRTSQNKDAHARVHPLTSTPAP